MRYVDIDFETMSAVDLKVAGARRYAEDPTTEIICLVVQDSDGLRYKWVPGEDTLWLANLTNNPEVIFVAHNAGFEQAIWECIMVSDFGMPPLPPERWEDTMATCAWKSLPLKLEKAAHAAKLPIEKDMEGNRLTLAQSRLNKKTGMYPPFTVETRDRIADYCAQDVAVEGQLRQRLGLLSQQSPQERGIWLLDQKINQRGVRIDLDFVRAAQQVVDRATVPLLAEFRDLTGGINPGQRDKVIAWASTQGVELENLQKGYLEELLGNDEDEGYVSNAAEDDNADSGSMLVRLPERLRRVLQIRQMLGSASIKKLARMQSCVGYDGRARGLLQYHAANTGRWGGRLLQPQNFPRGTLKDTTPADTVDAIMSGDPEYVEAMLGRPAIECVASSLRHALVPDRGNCFLVGDFAGIEARVVLALAGQIDKCALMASGKDVYLDMACEIYHMPKGSLTKADLEMRQTGKNAVLGCGFQCGPANFNVKFMGGKDFDTAERAVQTYRREWAPEVPKLWYALESAALRGVTTGRGEAYGVMYTQERGWLVATLPTRWQHIWYPRPVYHTHDERFGEHYHPMWTYDAYKGGKLSHINAYGGLLTENVVQGLARGLLVAAMMRLERAGYPIVLTVHDECVVEMPEDRADVKAFEQLMAEPTEWAERIGIPIAVEAWAGDRYRK